MTTGGNESFDGMKDAVLDAEPTPFEDASYENIIEHFDNLEGLQFSTETNTPPREVNAANVDDLLKEGMDIAPELIEGIKDGSISLTI